MSSSQPISSLSVQLQRPDESWVGAGTLFHDGAVNWFEFDSEYWEQSDRPVLGQIFEEHGRDWAPRAHVSLPKWFSHLLPEGRMRKAVASAADVSAVREFELIRRLGATDLPGAIRVVPHRVPGVERNPPELEDHETLNGENPLLKFSLAGAQLKYSLFRNDLRALTIPVKGTAGNVIAKLQDGRPGYDFVPEAEFAALQLSEKSGIQTVTSRLVAASDISGIENWAPQSSSSAVLVVDRFDRTENGERVHMEELAQIMNISAAKEDSKYRRANFETVANYVAALTDVETVAEVIDRIVLNVLVGNGDAHLKNWAFLYRDGKNPTLSPAYDIVPTVLYMAHDDLGLNLNGSKSFAAVEFTSFDELGRRTSFGVAAARQRARMAASRVLDNWNSLAEALSADQYSRLTTRLKDLPIAVAR